MIRAINYGYSSRKSQRVLAAAVARAAGVTINFHGFVTEIICLPGGRAVVSPGYFVISENQLLVRSLSQSSVIATNVANYLGVPYRGAPSALI